MAVAVQVPGAPGVLQTPRSSSEIPPGTVTMGSGDFVAPPYSFDCQIARAPGQGRPEVTASREVASSCYCSVREALPGMHSNRGLGLSQVHVPTRPSLLD